MVVMLMIIKVVTGCCDGGSFMNNGQHITMCALFLCNGFADLAVGITNYDDDDDCSDCGDNDDEQCTMHIAQHITMCALFLCNGFADLAVSISYCDDDDDCADCDDLIMMNNAQCPAYHHVCSFSL